MLVLVLGLGGDDSLFGCDFVESGDLLCLLVSELFGEGGMFVGHSGDVVVVSVDGVVLIGAEISLGRHEVGLKFVDQVDDLVDDALVREVVLGAGELDQGFDHWGVSAAHLEVREFLLNGLEGLASGLQEYGTAFGRVVELINQGGTFFTSLDSIGVLEVTVGESGGIGSALRNSSLNISLVLDDVSLGLGDDFGELIETRV